MLDPVDPGCSKGNTLKTITDSQYDLASLFCMVLLGKACLAIKTLKPALLHNSLWFCCQNASFCICTMQDSNSGFQTRCLDGRCRCHNKSWLMTSMTGSDQKNIFTTNIQQGASIHVYIYILRGSPLEELGWIMLNPMSKIKTSYDHCTFCWHVHFCGMQHHARA